MDLEALEKNKLSMKREGLMIKYKSFLLITLVYCSLIGVHGQKTPIYINTAFSSLLIKATGAKISGDLYAADSLYKKCLKLNPKSAVIHFELSGLFRTNERINKAIEYAEKAVELSPLNEWYLANLAVLYQQNADHKKSAAIFLRLTEIEPHKVTYLFSLTEAYLASNKFKKSLKTLNLIESEVGVNQDISLQKHQLYVYLKKKKKALKALQELVDESPDDIRNIGLLAEYYESLNKTGKSIILLKKMMDLDSSNGLVRLSMFQHYYKKKEYTKGLYELKKVMQSFEVDENLKKDILSQISYDQFSPYTLNDVNSLTKLFINVHPNNSEILLFFGNLKFLQRKEDSACLYLRKSLLLNPLEYDAWIQLISSSLSRGKLNQAIEDAKLASENHPNQPFPFFACGLALNSNQKYDLALKELNRGKLLVIDDHILESDFYQQIADAYYGLKDLKEAFKNYELAVNLNPKNSILLNNYSYYLALANQNLIRAESLIIKAIQITPNSPTFLDTYGWVLFQKKEYKKAEEVIFKAVMLSEESSGEILEHYGDVLNKLGKIKESLLFWNKAKENGEHSEKLLNKIHDKKYSE